MGCLAGNFCQDMKISAATMSTTPIMTTSRKTRRSCPGGVIPPGNPINRTTTCSPFGLISEIINAKSTANMTESGADASVSMRGP